MDRDGLEDGGETREVRAGGFTLSSRPTGRQVGGYVPDSSRPLKRGASVCLRS